jgi:uncharacterized protein (TIGR02246 family)
MPSDEQEIRRLVADWMEATKQGDVQTVLGLMTDDVVFLVPGQEPMRKPAFEASFKKLAAPSGAAPRIDGVSEIQEIKVLGDWAFMWTKLKVTMTPTGGTPMVRTGYTLSILQKQNGQWRLARDANLLSAAAKNEKSGA